MIRGRQELKSYLRVVFGCLYDFLRYTRYARLYQSKTRPQRSYEATKKYHSLEKSLSFRTRSDQSGWRTANQIIELFETSKSSNSPQTQQEHISLKVLKSFVAVASTDHPDYARAASFLSEFSENEISEVGGAIQITSADLRKGILDDPERFFFSRRSVRDYSARSVSKDLVERAVNLATASPSVCNRQAWHVYYLAERGLIDKALSHQNGNRGFGHEVPCLLIVAADLEAFESGHERYQLWIDGGMFAMSVVWALHSLGVSTCCLNWSKNPRGDKAFRKELLIREEHSIITMIAVGYPHDQIKVCASARRPVRELMTTIEGAEEI